MAARKTRAAKPLFKVHADPTIEGELGYGTVPSGVDPDFLDDLYDAQEVPGITVRTRGDIVLVKASCGDRWAFSRKKFLALAELLKEVK